MSSDSLRTCHLRFKGTKAGTMRLVTIRDPSTDNRTDVSPTGQDALSMRQKLRAEKEAVLGSVLAQFFQRHPGSAPGAPGRVGGVR